MKIMTFLVAAIIAISTTFVASPVKAQDGTVHVVEMLNKSDEGNMVFKPAVVYVAVGDTVRFVPTTPGHNAQSFKDMTPEGGTVFKTKMNKETDVVIDAEGIWAYNCLPHKAMGMVGFIVAGEADLAAFEITEKLPPLTKKRLNLYKNEAAKYSNKVSE